MKKLITLFLALVMVLSMFAACSDKKPQEQPEGSESTPSSGGETPSASDIPSTGDDAPSTAGPGGETTPPEVETSVNQAIGIPEDLNYEGNEFTIVHWEPSMDEFDVSAEDQTGDPILDAIYKRNIYTEDLLDVELNFIHNQYISNTVAGMNTWCDNLQNIMSDPSTPVDVFASYSRVLSTATVRGFNQDITVYDNIDLTKEWWPSAIIDELSIDGKLFIFTGDISTNVLHMMYAFFYNKTMAEAYGLPDMIELVENKEWTIDKMIELTSMAYQDMAADGKTPDDQFGITFDWWNPDAIIQGADFKILEADKSGDSYIKITEEFFGETFDSFIDKLGDWAKQSAVFDDPDSTGKAGVAFDEGRAMFYISNLSKGFSLQELDIDYSVIPSPLRDQNQERYRTALANSYTNYGMSRGCKDGERAAAVISTLGYYGYKLTTPAIFDVTFKGKFSKDPTMIDMLDRIRSGISFDMGLLYMRELASINDKPTQAILNNTDWLGVAMNAFQQKSLNTLLRKFNGKLETAVNG